MRRSGLGRGGAGPAGAWVLAASLALSACVKQTEETGGDEDARVVLRATTPRPDAVKADEAVAAIVLVEGSPQIRSASGQEFAAAVGHPLVRGDVVVAPSDALVIVLLENGYLVRVDADLQVAVHDFALIDQPRSSESISAQVASLLSPEERTRAGGDGLAERIAGFQVRLGAGESLPPESAKDRAVATAPAAPAVGGAPAPDEVPKAEGEPPEEARTAEDALAKDDNADAPTSGYGGGEKANDDGGGGSSDPPGRQNHGTQGAKAEKKRAGSGSPQVKPVADEEPLDGLAPEPAPKQSTLAKPIAWVIRSGGRDQTPKGALPRVFRDGEKVLRAAVAEAVRAKPSLPSTVRVVFDVKGGEIVGVSVEGLSKTPAQLTRSFLHKKVPEVSGEQRIIVKVPR
ncbi:MAG: hypothetical protein KC636_07830 [Myxococcales bacterium]|nr:hypothetical protein [Myxococcales bacterium]